MNKKITIIKRNEHGEPVFQYQGEIRQHTEKGLLVSAIFRLPQVMERDITFLKGDRFEECYLFNKWFNIYQVHVGRSEQIKAWYCNICRPMLYQEDRIEFDDLALDLLIYPDGRQYILDRDEFRALHINGHERRLALESLEELQGMIKASGVPDLTKFL
ncbi:MAG: DUF402 domain-containing protein [Anaerolineaceae bacterium]